MIEIRPAQLNDATAACDVLRRCILAGCVEDHRNDELVLERWLRNKTPTIVESWFAWPTHFPLVAVADNAIVGVAMLSRPGKVVLLHVEPESRFSGIGTALLRALEEHAGTLGVSLLRVGSTMSAQPFFERHSYIKTGTANVAYGQAVMMTKRLEVRRRTSSKACNCIPFDEHIGTGDNALRA